MSGADLFSTMAQSEFGKKGLESFFERIDKSNKEKKYV